MEQPPSAPVPIISEQQHLEAVSEAATQFLLAIGAASEAGVSQAKILPMLMELLRDSGISPDAGSLMSALG